MRIQTVNWLSIFETTADCCQPDTNRPGAGTVPSVRCLQLPQTGESRRDISFPTTGLLVEIEYSLQWIAEQSTGKISGQFQHYVMLQGRAVRWETRGSLAVEYSAMSCVSIAVPQFMSPLLQTLVSVGACVNRLFPSKQPFLGTH